jgi:hypothetical protein
VVGELKKANPFFLDFLEKLIYIFTLFRLDRPVVGDLPLRFYPPKPLAGRFIFLSKLKTKIFIFFEFDY